MSHKTKKQDGQMWIWLLSLQCVQWTLKKIKLDGNTEKLVLFKYSDTMRTCENLNIINILESISLRQKNQQLFVLFFFSLFIHYLSKRVLLETPLISQLIFRFKLPGPRRLRCPAGSVQSDTPIITKENSLKIFSF